MNFNVRIAEAGRINILFFTCFEYIRILSNSFLSAKAATTFGVARALIYIFRARSLSTVWNRKDYHYNMLKETLKDSGQFYDYLDKVSKFFTAF